MNKYFIFFLLFFSHKIFSQTLPLQNICAFPSYLQETSGIFATDNGQAVWTHTDSGGESKLYKMDTLGNVLRTVFVKNASNIDWEDITTDDAGNVYIGDFGNNANNRQDLKIYKIPNPDTSSSDTLTAEMIRFSYSNQTQFPPANTDKNFDAEAFVWLNDSLHIFSKNQTNPFNGYTQHFILPADTGLHIAQLRDSFLMGTSSMYSFWVTSAAMNPSRDKLVLLTSDRIALFSAFSGANFFEGTVQIFPLSEFSQKEGICFVGDSTFYISDEYFATFSFGGNLYKTALPSANTSFSDNLEKNIMLYPNPTENELHIYFNNIDEKGSISIYNMQGDMLLDIDKTSDEMNISTFSWKKGVYVVCWKGKMIGKIAKK